MGIWDTFRRFSSRDATSQGDSTNRRRRRGGKRLKQRGLRLEQFEARVLLSITTGDLQSSAWSRFADEVVALPGPNEMQLVVAANSVDDLRYKVAHNVDAADTTNAEDLHPGGSLGLDLTGSGYTVGIWDGGAVLDTHQEFGGRVTVIDGSTPDDHATHVAGTIGAAGVDASAEGMASGATIRSYDWTDDYAEMATDAGLIDVSNHSYGLVSGWTIRPEPSTATGLIDVWFGDYSISAVEDAKFGQYSDGAAQLDQALYDNPNLLSVWSAGNDRGDEYLDISGSDVFMTFFSVDPGSIQGWDGPGMYIVSDTEFTPPPGDGNAGTGYDTVSADQTAKNCLTVGAVDDVTEDPYVSTNITMSSFSAWGPTDDGRIKPDVVGNGIDLYSTLASASDAYGVSSGTSMASPNVAGSSVLLVEHFENAMGYTPRSATTKGLIIHTAADAGTIGPDYVYGWGLMDTKAAAEFVTEAAQGKQTAQVIEGTYLGAGISMDVYSAGLNPLTVTLAWTDPASGPSSGAVDDTTRRLVNDLDLWLEDQSGTVYYPWTLDPANPDSPAVQTQANHIDNVEQVEITLPTPGLYTIHVGSTDAVANQAYSLLISNYGEVVPPELVLVIPQEGGFIDRGETLSIAPRELTLRFNEGQQFIDTSTTPPRDPNGWLSGGRDGIQVTRSVNGIWGDGDDQVVPIGWIGIGDRPNDVVLRFAESLPDDLYRISIIGSDDYLGPDDQPVGPLTNTMGLTFRYGQEVVDEHFAFELDLGAQVTAVVPQPIVVAQASITATSGANIPDGYRFTVGDGKDRVVFEIDNSGAADYVPGKRASSDVAIPILGGDSAASVAHKIATAIQGATAGQGGALDLVVAHAVNTQVVRLDGDRLVLFGDGAPLSFNQTREQLTDTIDVYFNDDDLNKVSAETPKFYQLIVTNDTATPDDDVVYDPADGPVPIRALHPVEVIYDADLDKAILRFEKPLHEYGTGAFRLRVGSEYKKIETYALAASVEVLSGRLAQSGYQTVIAGPGSETVDGTRLGMSDGQLDVALEMDLRAVVLTVPGIVSTLPDGTILQLDDGTNVIRFEIDNPYAPGRVPGFADAAAVPITITGNSPAEAAEAIAAAIASTGFTALVDPTAAGRLLVVDALEAVTSTPQLAVSTPGFALLEPADLSSLVDGEWFEVDGLRYELDIAGDGANGSDTDVLVPITTLTRGSVAAAIAAQLQLHGESALASDTRVFLLSAASLTAAVPEMTVNDAVFSIQPPAVTSNVEDGEWLEINTGSRVRRFEFDRDGAWDGNAVRVDISSLNITVALKSAVDAEFAAEISRGEITTLVSGNRLILVGVAHVQRGGVDPDMNVVNGFAIDVPHGLGAGNDGEYLELIDASAPKSVVRFEFDSNGVVGTDAVLVPISGTGTIDAQRLRNEMDTRGYATVLSGARVYVLDIDDVVQGDVGALHLAIEQPGSVSSPADGVVAFHAGMTAAEIAAAIVAEMNSVIAAEGLYLSADSSGANVTVSEKADAGDSFHTANDLLHFGNQPGAHSVIVSAAIDPQPLLLEWPGAVDEPGHRDLANHLDILIEDHYMTGASSQDRTDGITEYYYNFRDIYGYDQFGTPMLNNITEAQKQRTREIMALYAEYLGVSFVETADQGFLIATGDLKAAGLTSFVGGTTGVAYQSDQTGYATALMDKAELWGASEFGGGWFRVAMHEIGHLLGYGHAYDLVAGSIMGSGEDMLSGINTEPIFPGDHDIVHGQHMYRPDSIDVDLYRFELTDRGTLTLEAFAERLNDSSQLDSVLTLYRAKTVKDANGHDKTTYEVVARNDDYYSKDSFLELYLQPGVYFVGVSASGNIDYDPNIEDTGVGGVTQGEYKLRMTFSPGGVDPDDPNTFRGDPATGLVDTDGVATKFDGDADGVPGGDYRFWFNVQPQTIFVDKASASPIEDGTLANPYKTISKAFTQAGAADTIIRILGNNFYDDDPDDLSTYSDNQPYQIGANPDTALALADGRTMEIPQGVTVMIDAGAVFKLSGANIDVGSSAEGIDRSGGALQVLGTPEHSVMFTSFRDAQIGVDIDPSNKAPDKGNWGGLVFRNELDFDFAEHYNPASGLPPREVLETQGIFLNYVNHANIRYGGGEVTVNGVRSVYAPIHMIEARPTISRNTILKSADAALSADPNSFADTQFQSWNVVAPWTADYGRVGPDVHGNTIVENSINGMFVRISTSAGQPIDKLEVPGRFDDWDIVHVIAENLSVSGTPGGPLLSERTNPLVLLDSSHIQAVAASDPATGALVIPDQATFAIYDGATRVVFEFDLGAGITPGHVAISYQSDDTAAEIAAAIRAAIKQARQQNGLDIDVNLAETGEVVTLTNTGPIVRIEGFGTDEARLDARLQIDPGLIVKLDGSRIEMGMGSQLIAEGRPGADSGAPGYKVILTSLLDDRYGAGGTFDTSSITSGHVASPGDWGGLYFAPTSSGSIDNAIIAYGGGTTPLGGGFENFSAVEIYQADVRIARSRFENNHAEAAGDRGGHGPSSAATIQVRGAQPVLVGNDFVNNLGTVVSIDVNSLASETIADWGRSTGLASLYTQYAANRGPMIRANRMTNNGINGMEVRGGILTTESVWDDTNIVHVVYDEIVVPNYHHEGGLRLQSSNQESLVVKLFGANAGFTASGDPLEIEDRIGGTLQILGQPGHPVVLTSLRDDAVGAGFTLAGLPQTDTNNDGNATSAEPGQWRSVRLDAYSNDRNVAVVNEVELPSGIAEDANWLPGRAQNLGSLAPEEKAGDDNLRLGFEVHGTIRTDSPTDVDVYTFNATAGTEIWLDVDRTRHALDLVIELIDADGNVLSRSDNSPAEERAGEVEKLSVETYTMDRDYWLRHDFYSTNERDPGMRLILPGPIGQMRTYYVRVRSVLAIGAIPAFGELAEGGTFTIRNDFQTFTFEFDSDGSVSGSNIPVSLMQGGQLRSAAGMAQAIVDAVAQAKARGLEATARVLDGKVVLDGPHLRFNPLATPLAHLANTSGQYQLQLRLREMQEVPGSTVHYADVRYATNGIEVLGQPGHSPLLGETAEVEGPNQTGVNDTVASAQHIGNLLGTDQSTISIAGFLANRTDVDWYRMTVDYQGIQSIRQGLEGVPNDGITDTGSVWATIFDIDYADGMARPDLTLWVFDSQGRLILIGGNSNVADDQPDPISGASVEDLSRGSQGARDPFIGTAYLPEGNGQTYYIAVTSSLATADALADSNPLTRREPINSVKRVVEERISPPSSTTIGGTESYVPAQRLTLTPNEFTFGDVIMYVNQSTELYTVDPFTGQVETDVTPNATHIYEYQRVYKDIVMRNDARLYTTAGRTPGGGDKHPAIGNIREFNTGDASLAFVYDHDEGIVAYQLNAAGTGLEVYQPGVQFEAMTFGRDGREMWIVGNTSSMPRGWASNPYNLPNTNLLYRLEPNNTADQQGSLSTGDRLGTNYVPYGWLTAAPTLVIPGATDTIPDSVGNPYDDRGDIKDGDAITLRIDNPYYTGGVYDPADPKTWPQLEAIIEFDLGVEASLNGNAAAAVNDGDFFTLNGRTYEFNSGNILVVNNVDDTLDDAILTLVEADGDIRNFEFGNDGQWLTSYPRVPFTNLQTRDQVAQTLATVISNNSSIAATAVGDRVLMSGDHATIPAACSSSALLIAGTPGVTAGHTAIPFEQTDTPLALMAAIESAVEGSSTITVGYAARTGTQAQINTTGHRLTFHGLTSYDFGGTPALAYLRGAEGYSAENGVTLHADSLSDQIATLLAQAINAGRVTIPDPVNPGVNPPVTLRLRQDLNVTARASAGTIELVGADVDASGGAVSGAPALQRVGPTGGAGGMVSGITMIGSRMFCVTDAGDLFEVHNYTSYDFSGVDPSSGFRYMVFTDQGPWLEFIANFNGVLSPGDQVQFSGLDNGPNNVEQGRYAEMLFATTLDGRILAFDGDGNLQPVFMGGNPYVNTGLSGAVGIAFSPIDYNLWHWTDQRWNDAGHGTNASYDASRTSPLYPEPGNYSYYFGLERADDGDHSQSQPGEVNFRSPSDYRPNTAALNTYNLPGGAFGSLTSGAFSLKGYAYEDKPVLYFNYFAHTENSDDYDGFRVYVSADGAKWDMIATNTDLDWWVPNTDTDTGGPLDETPIQLDTQHGGAPDERIIDEVIDVGDGWRQARIDLSRYAGIETLQLRFDFSTASDMGVGEDAGQGEYLTTPAATGLADGALPGAATHDGRLTVESTRFWINQVLVNGNLVGGDLFEYDLGYALYLPNVAGHWIPDGEWFQISDGINPPVRFEFDTNGAIAATSHVAIGIDATMSSDAVADAVVAAVNGAVGLTDVTAIKDQYRVFLKGSVAVTQSAAPKVALLGDNPGTVTPGAVAVPLMGNMRDFEVAEVLAKVLNQEYSSRVQFGGTDQLKTFAAGQIPHNQTFTLRVIDAQGIYRTVSFRFDRYGVLSGANVVDLSTANTAVDVAQAVANTINSYAASLPSALEISATAVGDVVTLDGPITFVDNAGPLEHLNRYDTTAKRDDGLGNHIQLFLNGRGPHAEQDPAFYNLTGSYTSNRRAVTTPGVLGYANSLYGDQTSGSNKLYGDPSNRNRFTNFRRGQNNNYEGVYIDDIIIGFAERGEMVTGAPANTTSFTTHTQTPTTPTTPTTPIVTEGAYQLEIRRGEDYGQLVQWDDAPTDDWDWLRLNQWIDTNDRLASGFTLLAPPASEIAQRDTIELSEGMHERAIKFHATTKGGDARGKKAVYFNSQMDASAMADAVAAAINQAALEPAATRLGITAVSGPSSERVILFGAAQVAGLDYIIYGPDPDAALVGTSFPQGRVVITEAVNAADATAAQRLVESILGPGVTLVPSSATYVGGMQSAGFWSDGVNQGIILATGTVYNAEGPNLNDASGNATTENIASGDGDADLDQLVWPLTTEDSSVLEFDFDFEGGDLTFEFVFASEEYNEWTYSQYNDVFAFYLESADGVSFPKQNLALVPGTSIPISVNTVNGGSPYGDPNASYPEYFNNNAMDEGGAFLGEIGYDGFTDILTARAAGLAAGRYHMKLAISDTDDRLLDTAVFVKAGTFSNVDTGEQPDQFQVVRTSIGDENHERQKGQIVITGNSVMYSLHTGILVGPAERDGAGQFAHPASGRTVNEPNDLVGGVMIENNLVAYSGQAGIAFRGDTNPAGEPVGAVPFGRIVNNTVFGYADSPSGVGILVENTAGPTLLNNIVAGLGVGVQVDTSSVGNTVLGGMLYQNNATNVQGTTEGTLAQILTPTQPLFVDAAGGNFYLDHGSLAIDSSIDSVAERQAYFNNILNPMGIPASPILAPDYDLFGQLRRDDPAVASPVGLGQNVYKDRGAIDRVDFVAPTSSVIVPLDNGPDDEIANLANDLKVVGKKVLKFTIQLSDTGGVGIDDASVVTSAIHLYRDLDESTYLDPATRDPELVEGIDYKMVYNATNDTIDLIPLAGLWAEGFDYTIVLDQTIRDLANNALQPNRFSGTFNGLTVFNISLAGLDFGDAPDDPSNPNDYPTLLASNGPRHVVWSDFHLGAGVSSESDARTTADADGDTFDDGVILSGSGMLSNATAALTINVTMQNPSLLAEHGDTAYVAAWFDFERDGDFGGPGDHFQVISVHDGANSMAVPVPAGVGGPVFARFRFGSVLSEVTSLTGQASDGEVEDYVFHVVDYLKDFGDAPNGTSAQGTPQTYPTTVANNGAWHATNLNPDLYLGSVPPDSELDGKPSADGRGDDLAGVDDEDGVDLANRVLLADGGTPNAFPVTVTGEGYLNAWIDLNADGDWDDAGEHFAQNVWFQPDPGTDWQTQTFSLTIPALPGGLEQAVSYARFRVSSTPDLGYAGPDMSLGEEAVDGEVEDYRVFIVNQRMDYGDAPDGIAGANSYPTLRSSNGASHVIVPGLALGQRVDAEFDGQPSLAADGDDTTYPTGGADDEDGVSFSAYGMDMLGRLVPGQEALITIDVTNTFGLDAYLYGWIDFNGDGDWDDPGEQILGSAAGGQPISPTGIYSITVPELFDPENPAAISVLGDTYARFRLSSDENLSYDGPASDGEVEDYLVTIAIGDTTIEGFKFNDINNSGTVDAGEAGLPGAMLYLDLNNDGQFTELDTDGDGVVDWSEPVAITRRDNLATPAVNEAGLFEFSGLFPGSYVVREDLSSLPGWQQTFPNMDAPVPGGQMNADGSYTITVGAGETVSDLLFGNFQPPRVAVTDVSVAEGAEGETTIVNVTFERTGSFGAPVVVNYRTVDGTAVAGDAPGVAGDNDYEAVDSSFTFFPQTATPGQWTSRAITHNATNDYDYSVSGDAVVFEAIDPKNGDWDISVYCHEIGMPPLLLTDAAYQAAYGTTDERFGDVQRIKTATQNAIYVVWSGWDGNDYEIFFAEVEVDVAAHSLSVVRTAQLTDNAYDDLSPQISESHIAWSSANASGKHDIYVQPIATIGTQAPQKISSSDYDSYDPEISGDKIVWHAKTGASTDIFLWDGTETRQVTANGAGNAAPHIDGNHVVWQALEGNDFDIFLYQIDAQQTRQISTSSGDDITPRVSGDSVVWQGGTNGNRDIFLYNIADGGAPANISNTYGVDEQPQISNNQIVWHHFDGNDWEVMHFDQSLPFAPTNVSNNYDYDWGPQISDDLLVWRSNDGQDFEIVVATQALSRATQTVQLVINGDNVVEDDEYFFVEIYGVDLGQFDATRATIGIYNDDGALDYGDAPASYRTRIADNGPRHVTQPGDASHEGYYLGQAIDTEADGQPSARANGDDISSNAGVQDEDGVEIRSYWVPGGTVEMLVTVSKPGYLDAWVDFDRNGQFGDAAGNADPYEQLFSGSRFIAAADDIDPATPGIQVLLTTTVPELAAAGGVTVLGDSYARFRFSRDGGLSYIGSAMNGEVEDYAIRITTDKPGVTFTPSSGSNRVKEGGLSDTYTVVLNARPADDVTIDLTTNGQVTVKPTSLTFTPANWNQPQTVTIQAVDDLVAEGIPGGSKEHQGLIYNAIRSNDGAYNSLVLPPTNVVVEDNDVASVLIMRGGGVISVSESGGTDSYQVVLTSQPVGDVRVVADAGTQLLVAPAGPDAVYQSSITLSFNSSNWDQPQTVNVRAVDDDLVEGTHTASITHSSATSTDPHYAALTSITSVPVQIADNDVSQAGIVFTETDGGTAVTEAGPADTYQVALKTAPTSDVRITLVHGSQLVASPAELLFTPQNWATPQTVSVVAFDDQIVEGTMTASIEHLVESDDPAYSYAVPPTVEVTVTDNDPAASTTLAVPGTSGDDTLELVRGDWLTVYLNNQLIYAGTGIDTVSFDGGAGYDVVNVTGSADPLDAETAVIHPHEVTFQGTEFEFTAVNIERAVVASGGGDGDVAVLNDSPGDDTVVGGPTSVGIAGQGFSHQVDSFRQVQVYARNGGRDSIELSDSAGKDKVKVEADDTVKLYNPSYFIRGKFFEEITVLSTGGNDVGRIYDTKADDTMTASYEQIVVTSGAGSGLKREIATIRGFEDVILYATNGGYDTLNLYDSPGDDKAVLRSHKVEIGPRNPDTSAYQQRIVARKFDIVHAISAAGGNDYARIHDTPAIDLLVAGFNNGQTWAELSKPANGSGWAKMYDALGFDIVRGVNDYGDAPRNKKDVDSAVDFLMLDGGWDEI